MRGGVVGYPLPPLQTSALAVCPGDMTSSYLTTLQDHLASAGEAPVLQAFDLGRRAFTRGLSVLDLAVVPPMASNASSRSCSTSGASPISNRAHANSSVNHCRELKLPEHSRVIIVAAHGPGIASNRPCPSWK